jgi:hypothetical protein
MANYLEGPNATNPGGNSDYSAGAPTATFNDQLYCIHLDLSVSPCP